MVMTIEKMALKIKELNVPDTFYYINGIHGSTNDENKLAMRIHANGYEIYHMEHGDKNMLGRFENESEACSYFFEKLKKSWDFERIQRIEGLNTLQIDERLNISGLREEFDRVKEKDKTRAKEILRWLKVREPDIKDFLS